MMRFRSSRNSRFGTARFLVRWKFVGLLGLLVGSAWGQGPNRSASKFYPDSSDPAENLLRNAAGHVRARQWPEAVDLYQRVIDQFAGKVAKVPKDESGLDASGEFVLFMDARRFCHRALAQLPPEAREIYRNRVDALAERWFREGVSNQNEGSLRRVVDQAFCCSWGDDAVELLGDMAFQDGRFGDALALYRLLVADRADDPFALVHPDPTVDLAKVAAKKLLCRSALGQNVPTHADLDEYARRYPGAGGALAGRTGAYAEIVAAALGADHLTPPFQPDSRWPTFAGSLRRSKVVAGPIDVGSTQWRVELEKVQTSRVPTFGARMMGGVSTPNPPETMLAYHPIILGDQVIVTDGVRVLAYNLNDRPTGADGTSIRSVEPAWKHERDGALSGPQAMRPSPGVPRFTLTAVGHRIYARMGGMTQTFFSRLDGTTSSGVNSIIALDWSTQGKLLWEQKSTSILLPNRPHDRAGNRSVTFEGTPVADARNVYVAVTDRREQIATYVACYDAENGTPRWVRYLGSASADVNNFPGFGMAMPFASSAAGDYNHRLLSLDGPTLYYQTNLGAVVALEAETGTTLWVGTYPRQEFSRLGGGGSERDLNPAVIDDGRVFVAPSDSSAIFAFDASNGRLCWKSEPISDEVKLSHLLGVAKGRLVATGDRVLLFDVKTGKLLHAWPDSGRSLEGYGRGLLAGELIYWPTKNEIQVLNQRSGLLAEAPIRLRETYHTNGGNLAAGDGYLIVAQADGIVVFCQNSRLIERYRDAIVQAPDDASNYFRLAKASEALGRDRDALDAYRDAARKARSNETIDGVPLAASSRDHLFRLLVRLAGEARRARRWQEAVDRLEAAFLAARSDPERLQSQLQLADVLTEAGRPQDAVGICERILSDDRLRPLAVATADGHRTVRADLFITDRLHSIVRSRGRSVYASYDREAVQMFERGKKDHDSRTLDELCRRYPVAAIVPDALSELGAIYQASGRMIEATQAYKRLLSLAGDSESRARAGWRLARAYESRKLYLSARDTYLDLLARYPHERVPDTDSGQTVADLVTAELTRSPYSLLEGDRAQPVIPVPLFRRWHWQPPPNQEMRALSALGMAPSLDAGRLLIVEREGLRFLDPRTGSPRWFSELGAPILWAAYSADKIIVASAREIAALDLAQGAVAWRYGGAAFGMSRGRPDPFASPRADERNDSGQRTRDELHDLQVVKGRLFLLRGQHEFIALDVDTGAVDWSFSSPPREINPNLTIGDDRIWVQVNKPNQLLVLRADDGQTLARHSLGDNEVLKRPPVPVDEDSLLLVSDLVTVKKVDIGHGQTTWIYRESTDLPVNGPPRVFSDGERVLVLHDGRLLNRLDPATGSKRWSCLLGIEDLSERPGSMAFDDKRFYCASGRTLRAISLDDGTPVWSIYLSGPEEATWSIFLTGHHVLAYPSKTESADGGELDNMCVVVRRRETGALLQRFVFPTTIASVAFKADPRGVWVATARGLWALGKREGGSSPRSGSPSR
ncbi:MAG: PQQ-binding-like beta-propeller repeat protein [Isosphaeraceae bacterium]